MTFYNSPQVAVKESEAGVGVVETGSSTAAIALTSLWGPAEKPFQITAGESQLVRKFGKPNNDTYLGFFIAKDYCSYVSNMFINRLVGTAARNAVPTGNTPILLKNEDLKTSVNLNGLSFVGKYPGSPANGIVVDIADKNKFSSWEYASLFDYVPDTGEYSVAVIDSSGYWSGNGAQQQIERLSISGNAIGGVQQTQTITVSGTAAGGTKQQEILTVSGTATGTSITVDGVAVTLVVGDGASTVASKIASALAAVTASYTSAVANSNTVTVVFAATGSRNPIATTSSSGVSVISSIDIVGTTQFAISLADGTNFIVNNGDSAATVTMSLYNALNNNVVSYSNVTSPTTTTVRYTYVAYGPQSITASQVISGVTFATVVGTAGVATFVQSIFGVNVTLTTGDSAVTVANKIAIALIADSTFSGTFTNIQADKATVLYQWIAKGKRISNVIPTAGNGLIYYVDIKQVGTFGTMIEKYELLKQARGSVAPDGSTKYWYDAISKGSNVVTAGDSTFTLTASTISLSGGVDDNATVDLVSGLTPFTNSETYTIQYILAGHMDVNGQKTAIDIAESRKDCIAHVCPPLSSILNVNGNEMDNVVEWNDIQLNRESTYSFKTDNWGLIYDSYNDVNRWIPACGGDAGLHAATTRDYEAWYVPAGYQRGRYKNYIKMAWSASKLERDTLFPKGINSIVTFPGQGIILWGDKTGYSSPTNFDGINVRWAFIWAELGIANLSKNYIFELNNDFTRATFLAAIRSYLDGLTKRNAFEEYKVIVDSRNNDIATRAAHKLVATILLRPQFSVRFVELQFVAVGGTMTLTEVESSLLGSST